MLMKEQMLCGGSARRAMVVMLLAQCIGMAGSIAMAMMSAMILMVCGPLYI